jgi:hypothetical protein
MPNIKDQSTVEAIAREFCSNGRNKTEAMITVGYEETYANGGRGQGIVYGNEHVRDAISAIDGKRAGELEHNRATALELLHEAIAMARIQGNTAAIIAATRELDAISNLHKATIITESTPDQPTGAEAEAITEAAREYKRRISNIKAVS